MGPTSPLTQATLSAKCAVALAKRTMGAGPELSDLLACHVGETQMGGPR
jgi:hypothetical protein